MEPSYWTTRWHEGRTGFHQDRFTPLLVEHWPSVGVTDGCVFVPLAGKTLDMAWFAAHGYNVLGIELSRVAIEQFFAEYGKGKPVAVETAYGVEWTAGNVTMIEGDIFHLDASRLASCNAVFDRAAIIALPPEMRERYAAHVYSLLPGGCRGLMITLEYPQHEKSGPPFSVDESEIRELFTHDWDIDVLERRDILAREPKFAAEGVTALATVAYRVVRLG